jgi:signal transduction histidine kinase
MGDEIASLREEVEALRARLAVADQQTCDFVSRLAHELRTPLGAILMWGHVLRGGRESDRDGAITAIELSARAQSKMIGSLLDVCRGVTGRLRIESVAVDVSTVVRDAVAAMMPIAQTRNVTLTLKALAGPEPVRVSGDPVRVGEMVSILVDNALKFTPPQGTVQVALTADAATVRAIVRDSGRGLAAEELETLFVPFRPAAGGARAMSGGLGVGLALAKQLADLHHGTVSAESAGANTGSTFTLTLPRAG